MSKPVFLMLLSIAIFALGFSTNANAQIAPECEGVVVPDDYDEELQQAFLQNYFALAFSMTALHGPTPFTRDDQGAAIALEVGAVPPLGCQQRLVLGGIKTEDTNTTPVFPRPRLTVKLPPAGPIDSYVEVVLLPPVKTPLGTLLQVGTEIGAAHQFDFGLSIGARAHLSIIHVRAEIATPFEEGGAAFDDLLIASSLGAEATFGYTPDFAPWVTPYFNVGMGDVSTLFLVGDNLAIVQNTREPWYGVTSSLGVQLLAWDHLLFALEGSAAFPLFATAKAKVGFQW